jgi:hypothetical protein
MPTRKKTPTKAKGVAIKSGRMAEEPAAARRKRLVEEKKAKSRR